MTSGTSSDIPALDARPRSAAQAGPGRPGLALLVISEIG